MIIPILWARLERGIQVGGQNAGGTGPVRAGQQGVASMHMLPSGVLAVVPEMPDASAVLVSQGAWREAGCAQDMVTEARPTAPVVPELPTVNPKAPCFGKPFDHLFQGTLETETADADRCISCGEQWGDIKKRSKPELPLAAVGALFQPSKEVMEEARAKYVPTPASAAEGVLHAHKGKGKKGR